MAITVQWSSSLDSQQNVFTAHQQKGLGLRANHVSSWSNKVFLFNLKSSSDYNQARKNNALPHAKGSITVPHQNTWSVEVWKFIEDLATISYVKTHALKNQGKHGKEEQTTLSPSTIHKPNHWNCISKTLGFTRTTNYFQPWPRSHQAGQAAWLDWWETNSFTLLTQERFDKASVESAQLQKDSFSAGHP